MTTYEGYEHTTNSHIIPYLAKNGLDSNPVSEITTEDIKAYYANRMEHGRLDGKGGLSKNSVIQHHCVIKQALDYTRKVKKYITVNPAADIHLGQPEKYNASYYNTQEMAVLLDAAKGEVMEPIIQFAALYGTRRSEGCGLKWNAVDFVDSTIRIQHTVVKCRSLVQQDKAKNQSSLRTYPVLDEVREILLGMREQQRLDKLNFGSMYQDTEYIFRWPDGHPIAPDYVSQRYRRILEKNGLRHIRFHDLRHSCASMLLAMGYSLKDIADWLGHSDIKTTANIYGHLEVAHKKDMGRKLAGRLKLADERPEQTEHAG